MGSAEKTVPELLKHVAWLLDISRPVPPGTYVLFVRGRKIELGDECCCLGVYNHIVDLDSRDINEGLAPTMWNWIADEIWIFKREDVL